MAVFADPIGEILYKYPLQNLYSMYLPLGSHDTRRLMTKLAGDLPKVKLAFLFQFAFPGAPAVYYGDEVGLEGGKDPDCRRAFPWDEKAWNRDLRAFVQRLICLRRERVELRRGDFQVLFTDPRRGGYAFSRQLGQESVLVVLNANPVRRTYKIPVERLGWEDGWIVRDLLSDREELVSGDQLVLTLEPWTGAWMS